MMVLILGVGLNLPAWAASNPESHRILYLGDSMSMGAFGRTFDSSLREKELEVYTHVAGGASPYYWLRRYEPISCSIGYWEKTPSSERRVGYVRAVPKVEDLIDSYTPDIVVVQTGVNLYATLRSKRRTAAENVEVVKELLNDMCRAVHRTGAYSYWITPPASHPNRYSSDLQAELTQIMKSVVGESGGTVFESARVTSWTAPYPAESDGIHYGPVEAREWAEGVAGDFTRFLETIETKPVTPVATPIRATPIALSPRDPSVDDEASDKDDPAEDPEDSPPAATAEPGQMEDEVSSDPPEETGTVGASDEAQTASDEITVKIVLKKKSEISHLNEVTYDNAFGLYEYDVVEVSEGNYPFKKVRVAHMVVLHKEFTGATRFEIGKTYSLTLVKQSRYPSLERVQLVDALPMDLDLPVYICKF